MNLRAQLYVVASALACACGASGNGGAGGSNGGAVASKQETSEVTSDLSDELRSLSAHPDLEIVVRAGTQHWKAGEITVTVRGDGAAQVVQRLASGDTRFEAALTRDEVDALGRELGQRRFTERRASKLPREPGDTPVHLALRRDGKAALEVEVWEADRDGDADLDAILIASRRLIHRITKGALGAP